MPRTRAAPPVLGQTRTMTKDQARLEGVTKYFDGFPCVQGHLDWRSASTGQCRSCQNPPPITTICNSSSVYPYKYTMAVKTRLLAMPQDDAQLRSLTTLLEKAAREWAYSWGLAQKPPGEFT